MKIDVARHQRLGGDRLAAAVAQHVRLQRQHLADRVERSLRLALLQEADERVDDDDADDDRGVDPMLHRRRDRRRGQQHVDQDVVELQQQPHQRPAPLRRPKQVRSAAIEAPSRLRRCESLSIGLQFAEDTLGRHRVPLRRLQGLRCASCLVHGVVRRRRRLSTGPIANGDSLGSGLPIKLPSIETRLDQQLRSGCFGRWWQLYSTNHAQSLLKRSISREARCNVFWWQPTCRRGPIERCSARRSSAAAPALRSAF